MSNMSYCRFQNTERDLRDCADALEGLSGGEYASLSREELDAAKSLVQRCIDIAILVAEHAGIDVDIDELENKAAAAIDSMQEYAVEQEQAAEEQGA